MPATIPRLHHVRHHRGLRLTDYHTAITTAPALDFITGTSSNSACGPRLTDYHTVITTAPAELSPPSSPAPHQLMFIYLESTSQLPPALLRAALLLPHRYRYLTSTASDVDHHHHYHHQRHSRTPTATRTPTCSRTATPTPTRLARTRTRTGTCSHNPLPTPPIPLKSRVKTVFTRSLQTHHACLAQPCLCTVQWAFWFLFVYCQYFCHIHIHTQHHT